MLMDVTEGFRFNPVHHGLELLAKAQNLPQHQLNTTEIRVHGLATVKKEVDSVEASIYVINKLESVAQTTVHLPTALVNFHDLSITAQSLVDTADHWGKLEANASSTALCTNSTCEIHLPPVSFSRIVISGSH